MTVMKVTNIPLNDAGTLGNGERRNCAEIDRIGSIGNHGKYSSNEDNPEFAMAKAEYPVTACYSR